MTKYVILATLTDGNTAWRIEPDMERVRDAIEALVDIGVSRRKLRVFELGREAEITLKTKVVFP